MEGILKVSPEKLISTASEFSNCGNAIKNITTEMTSTVNGLSAVFSGEDADAYKAKFNTLQGDIEKVYALVQKYSTNLTEMAQNYTGAVNKNTSKVGDLPSNVVTF